MFVQHRGQKVGQVTAKGFTPSTWTLERSTRTSYCGSETPGYITPGECMDLFVIDSATGMITSPEVAKLPARVHTITVTATDGPNLVTADFEVPVAPFTGGPVCVAPPPPPPHTHTHAHTRTHTHTTLFALFLRYNCSNSVRVSAFAQCHANAVTPYTRHHQKIPCGSRHEHQVPKGYWI
jgi:hypothetical protein